MKSKHFIARLLERAANIAAVPHLPLDAENSATALPRQIDINIVKAVPTQASSAPISSIPATDIRLETTGSLLVNQDPNEPPLICWKHKLYRQKVVDGGLEPYGPPVGDC